MTARNYGRSIDLSKLEDQANEIAYGSDTPEPAAIVECYKPEWLEENPEAYGDLWLLTGDELAAVQEAGGEDFAIAHGYETGDIKHEAVPHTEVDGR